MSEVSSIFDPVAIASHTNARVADLEVLVWVRARKAAPVDPFEDPVAQFAPTATVWYIGG